MRGETDGLSQSIAKIIHSLQIIQVLCTPLSLHFMLRWPSHPVLTTRAAFKTPLPGVLFLVLPGQMWVLSALGGMQRAAKGTVWSFT